MSMLTLTPTDARSNLSALLRKALKGEDIGIVVDGKIVALRPVEVEAMKALKVSVPIKNPPRFRTLCRSVFVGVHPWFL